MKKSFIISSVLLLSQLSVNQLFAQENKTTEDTKHQVELQIIPSMGKLGYKANGKKSNGAFGLGASATYTYLFNKNIGIGTGIRFQQYTGNIKISTHQARLENLTEPNGNNYNLTQTINNEEQQKVSNLLIPLLLQYRHAISNNMTLRFEAGPAWGMKVSESSKMKSGSITRTAYFPGADLTIDNLKEHGIGVFNDFFGESAGTQFKGTLMVMGELGAEYKLSNLWLVTSGINLTYGGNTKNQMAPVMEQNRYNGMAVTNMTAKINPISVGLSMGVVYRFGAKTQKTTRTPEIAPAPTPVTTAKEESKEEILQPSSKTMEVEEAKPPHPSAKEQLVMELEQFNNQGTIQFAFNSNTCNNQTNNDLDRLIPLIEDAQVKIITVGHACSIGSEASNVKLGMERATQVRQYLINGGVKESMIEIQSAGESKPAYSNDTEEGRAKNRRVEIIIQ